MHHEPSTVDLPGITARTHEDVFEKPREPTAAGEDRRRLPVEKRRESDRTERVRGADKWLVRKLLRRLGRPAVEVVLWDGTEIRESSEPPLAAVPSHDRAMLFRLIWQPSIAFAEGYQHGRIEIVGRLVEICRAVEETNGAARSTR